MPPPGATGVVTISCCRCLGQESDAAKISTGTAPWRVSSVIGPVNSPTNTSPLMVPGAIAPHSAWTTALAPAKWLQPSASTTRNDVFPNGHVTYALKIRVPNCAIGQRVTLSGRFAADDQAKMFVDRPGHNSATQIAGPAGFPTTAVKAQETQGLEIGKEPAIQPADPQPKRASKTDLVLELLTRSEGATIEQLVAATGWLPHTTRAALTGLKKKGHAVTSDKAEGAARVYRVASA